MHEALGSLIMARRPLPRRSQTLTTSTDRGQVMSDGHPPRQTGLAKPLSSLSLWHWPCHNYGVLGSATWDLTLLHTESSLAFSLSPGMKLILALSIKTHCYPVPQVVLYCLPYMVKPSLFFQFKWDKYSVRCIRTLKQQQNKKPKRGCDLVRSHDHMCFVPLFFMIMFVECKHTWDHYTR